MQIVSLFDYTGEALKPWAEARFECFAYDIQHTGTHRDGISFLHADLHDSATVRTIVERHAGKVRLVSAFPVCTDFCVGLDGFLYDPHLIFSGKNIQRQMVPKGTKGYPKGDRMKDSVISVGVPLT